MQLWTRAHGRTLNRLREAFARAEFNDDRLADAGMGARSGGSDEAWRLGAAAPGGALSVLVRLWMVGAAVQEADASEALAPATMDELEAAGLVARVAGGRVRAAIAIKPYRDLLIAGDRIRTELEEPPDFVPGVNPVARVLARRTVRTPVGKALDLATGNGMQMLAAARHASDVLGTDVNPRALAYADFNARLNGIDNVRLAEGSWFDPVGDEKFDLILANLPFVVSPDSSTLYRDSGGGPGEVSAAVVRGAAERLTEGGFARVLCEWGIGPGEEWARVPREWVAGTGCDAVILRHDHSDPVAHSVSWNHRLVGVDPDAFEEAIERWTEHHRAHGFEALAGATVVLRRRAAGGEPWVSALELVRDPSADGGDHVLRIFGGEDLLHDLAGAPEALLGARLALVDGVGLRAGAAPPGTSAGADAAGRVALQPQGSASPGMVLLQAPCSTSSSGLRPGTRVPARSSAMWRRGCGQAGEAPPSRSSASRPDIPARGWARWPVTATRRAVAWTPAGSMSELDPHRQRPGAAGWRWTLPATRTPMRRRGVAFQRGLRPPVPRNDADRRGPRGAGARAPRRCRPRDPAATDRGRVAGSWLRRPRRSPSWRRSTGGDAPTSASCAGRSASGS